MAVAKATTIKEAIKRWEEKTGLHANTATEVSLIFQWPPIEKMDNTLSCLTNCEKLSLSTNMLEKVTGLNSLKKLRVLSLGRNYIKSFAGMECLGETLEELWISYNLIEKLKGIHVLRNLKVLYMSNNLVKEWSEFNKIQAPCTRKPCIGGNLQKCKITESKEHSVLKESYGGHTYFYSNPGPRYPEAASAITRPRRRILSLLALAPYFSQSDQKVSMIPKSISNLFQELPHLEDLLFVGNPLYDACELEAWRSEAARRLPNLKKLDGETVLRDDGPLTVADMQPDGGDAVETLVSAETND